MKCALTLLAVIVATFQGAQAQCADGGGDGDIRVTGIHTANLVAGRLEICTGGEWWAVCQGGWGANDAAVACRQLGFRAEGAMYCHDSCFGHNTQRRSMYNVRCKGSEMRMDACIRRASTATSSCYKDAGLVCTNGTTVRDIHSGSPATDARKTEKTLASVTTVMEAADFDTGNMASVTTVMETTDFDTKNMASVTTVMETTDFDTKKKASVTTVMETTDFTMSQDTETENMMTSVTMVMETTDFALSQDTKTEGIASSILTTTPTTRTEGVVVRESCPGLTAVGVGLGALSAILAILLVGVVTAWVWSCCRKTERQESSQNNAYLNPTYNSTSFSHHTSSVSKGSHADQASTSHPPSYEEANKVPDVIYHVLEDPKQYQRDVEEATAYEVPTTTTIRAEPEVAQGMLDTVYSTLQHL